ncbi:MAG: hypothetical protein KBB04_05075 [Methanothrix sp.]|jgi:hypothetical protein|uniref:hypothetical protein n=1 Tax=Methanothrix sp. TaxID=90426 RepID=UPI001B43202F|nr:hypothetical protein [Methanothrix sp.]MBP7067635.1 hypothetical protein [Methanothrix sp.]
MTKPKFVFLGATINPSDKEAIDRIAEMNNVSISYVTRMLIADSIQHISERDIFKMEI